MEPKDSVKKANGFKAQLPADWYRFNRVKYFMMTHDGILLNQIAVERKKFSEKLEFTKRPYSENMTPDELASIELDNLKSSPALSKLEVLSNTPQKLSGQDAFKLEYRYVTSEGLIVKGVELGFVKDKRVYRIIYEAPEQHYFAASKPAFDRFLQTFEPI